MSFVFDFSRDFFLLDRSKIYKLSKMWNLDSSCRNLKENWQIFPIRQVKSTRELLHELKAFPNFSFVCFHFKNNLTSRQSKQES